MGGEILDHAHVAHAARERPGADRREREQPPQLTVGDSPAHLLQRDVEAFHVSHRAVDAADLRQADDLLGLLDGARERLLHQHRGPGRHQLAGDGQV
jgi:hypothetical protein